MSQFVERWPVGVRVPGSNPSDVRILYIKHGSVGESVHLYLRNVKQTVEPGSLKLGDRIKLKKKKKLHTVDGSNPSNAHLAFRFAKLTRNLSPPKKSEMRLPHYIIVVHVLLEQSGH